ncbi:hypothetical protein DFH06DRAFT_1314307 [Mycena polygramma]|nr:hypothetical protein DFH06DRAFT_1314307 [Mycena polygramma]
MPLRTEPAEPKWLADLMRETGSAMCIVTNLVTELNPLAPKLATWKSQRFRSYEFDAYFPNAAVQVAQSLPLVFIRLEETLEKHMLGSTMEALAQSIAVPPEDRLRLSDAIESAAWTLYQYVDLLKELVEAARSRQRIVSFIIGCRNLIEVLFCICTYFPPPMPRIAQLVYILIMSVLYFRFIMHRARYLSNLEYEYSRNKRQANRTLNSITLSTEWLAYEWSLMADQLKKPPEVDKEAEMAQIFLGVSSQTQGRKY